MLFKTAVYFSFCGDAAASCETVTISKDVKSKWHVFQFIDLVRLCQFQSM